MVIKVRGGGLLNFIPYQGFFPRINLLDPARCSLVVWRNGIASDYDDCDDFASPPTGSDSIIPFQTPMSFNLVTGVSDAQLWAFTFALTFPHKHQRCLNFLGVSWESVWDLGLYDERRYSSHESWISISSRTTHPWCFRYPDDPY